MRYNRHWDEDDSMLAFLWVLVCSMLMLILAVIPYSIRAGMAENEFQKAQHCVEIPGRVWDHKSGTKTKTDHYRHVLKCKGGYIEEIR